MQYELMDVESGNVVGMCDSEAEALAEVRALLRANGRGYARSLSLAALSEYDDGDAPIAQGAKLASRALAATPRAPDTIRA